MKPKQFLSTLFICSLEGKDFNWEEEGEGKGKRG